MAIIGIAFAPFQHLPMLNLIYSIGLMGMVLYCWQGSRHISLRVQSDAFLDYAFMPLYLCVFLSFVYRGQDSFAARYSGVFYTTAQAAACSSLCALVAAYRIAVTTGYKRIFFALCLVACVMLALMTRTRGPIVAMCLSVSLVWGLSARVGKGKSFAPAALLVLATLAIAAGALTLWEGRQEQVIRHLRLEDASAGLAEGLFATRVPNWERALASFRAQWMVGAGWLSRWGSDTTAAEPDYTFRDDPHNLVLTLMKSLGIAGAVLGLALLLTLLRVLRRQCIRPGHTGPDCRPLLAGIAAWILLTSVVGNSLISFGATKDRYCWVMLFLLLFEEQVRGHPGGNRLWVMRARLGDRPLRHRRESVSSVRITHRGTHSLHSRAASHCRLPVKSLAEVPGSIA